MATPRYGPAQPIIDSAEELANKGKQYIVNPGSMAQNAVHSIMQRFMPQPQQPPAAQPQAPVAQPATPVAPTQKPSFMANALNRARASQPQQNVIQSAVQAIRNRMAARRQPPPGNPGIM